MRLLVVNADDFGLSAGVNEGILEAHDRGIVTSASLMVLEPAAAAAARAAASRTNLSVGLHYVDDDQTDVGDSVHITAGFRRQLERFRELTGRDPTHIDSHHHVHTRSATARGTFAELAARLGVPVRGGPGVAYIGAFWGQWQPGVSRPRLIQRPFLVQLIRSRALDGWTELACHPGRVTGDFRSSYQDERAVELATLTEPGLREQIEAFGVRLVSFHGWKRVPRSLD